ncbi:Uu.00g122040.m01.CDS01 [Anthostomella pinea]|uniref:HECT-type E3 ubiquitin transferase n=1 Tax=Anthostomella pinea TaxID=933095 RepID=A0AAI8VI33_9PEZI|nr:Uu.00g122040.m01.CDS01 [Anthostomella pinea]
MFPTFSGTSRRPRNVNLSGQRNTSPWASSGGLTANSGSNKTIAQAQADREKRQRERDELAAAKLLQRVWRGHRERRHVKSRYRQEYDDICQQPPSSNVHNRVVNLLPLMLALFDPTKAEDQQRLNIFVRDLLSSGPTSTKVDIFDPSAWDRLARLLVGALERRPISSSHTVLSLLVDIIKSRPASIAPLLDRYYRLLARCYEENGSVSLTTDQQEVLSEASAAPLVQNASHGRSGLQAYQAFAYAFLTSSKLVFLKQNPSRIARHLDMQVLSQSIADAFSAQDQISRVPKEGLLWLLSHFIALNRAIPTSRGSKYLEALYLQLSLLAVDIRTRSNAPEELNDEDSYEEDEDTTIQDFIPLPEYVSNQLDFLVNEDGIAELLSRFTATPSSTTRPSDDASLLAGYTLVLLRCFPSHADDIKMRLFQGDISTLDESGLTTVPSVKYFWKAASRTGVFTSIMQPAAQHKPTSVVALLKGDPIRDLEWRTVLLFLELYNFSLRVTDDEDFLPAATQILSQQSPATVRIRSGSLGLTELKHLVNFLKHLSFPLYYNLGNIMLPPSQQGRLGTLMGVNSTKPTSQEEEELNGPSTFAGIIGMDALGLRDAATAAMRSLYERDSRRGFLPKGFWLMTSKFDMDGFVSAVVLEEQRKEELASEDDGSHNAGADGMDSFNTFTGHRLSRAAQIERHRHLRKLQREQLLAQVGPKLEILRNMPFVIPFEVRVRIFRQFVFLDKSKRRGGHVDPDRWRLSILSNDPEAGAFGGFGGPVNGPAGRARDILGRHTARVKRGEVFNDAFDQFYSLGDGLKEPIQITFVDQFDQAEAGIDGGGVTKEFLTSVTSEAFMPGPDGHKLFVTNAQNLLYPNPTAFDDRAELLRACGFTEGGFEWKHSMGNLAQRYEFLGRIVGKCMYEGILIDIAFASFFLLKWSSGQSTYYRANLNDLRDLDPELYQGLISLKNYSGDVADLALDFTITDQVTTPTGEVRTITRPLRKNGENTPVTNSDRPLYISYVAHHRLVAQPGRQTKAFLRGLGSIINPAWLSMFNQSELQRLVGGDSSEIDVEDLRNNTAYSGLYAIGDDGTEHRTIQLFWEVMRELKDSERRDVLKYVTSTPRAPLLGFSQLSPQFSIRDGGTDEERLPSTSTCVNLLKLPRYTSAETLRSKLLYAVQSGAGFDLS